MTTRHPTRQPGPATAARATVSTVEISLHVNGADFRVALEPRVTLLDALRERQPVPLRCLPQHRRGGQDRR